jgi:hypothetical protein
MWNYSLKKDIDKLERVQLKAKIFLKNLNGLNKNQRLKNTRIKKLTWMIRMLKIVNEIDKVKWDHPSEFLAHFSTRGH